MCVPVTDSTVTGLAVDGLGDAVNSSNAVIDRDSAITNGIVDLIICVRIKKYNVYDTAVNRDVAFIIVCPTNPGKKLPNLANAIVARHLNNADRYSEYKSA